VDPAAAVASPDAALVARCKAGDHDAWGELVERFSRYVYAISVQAYGLGYADAEDVFQDVFARAYERLGSLRDDGAVRPWIAQLTRHACVDRLRAADPTVPLDEGAEVAAIDTTLARLDEALAVRQELAALPEHCRDVLDRFFCRDESYAAISAALGISPGTVGSRIARCLERLRDRMVGKKPRPKAVR
jgi:RNA polymerase sigma-70 factor, ECF subfamily